jgi:hypothetical protein
MGQAPVEADGIQVTVRYFAAARSRPGAATRLAAVVGWEKSTRSPTTRSKRSKHKYANMNRRSLCSTCNSTHKAPSSPTPRPNECM